MDMKITNTIKNWHHLLDQKNPDLLNEILAEGVVFHSPVLHTPQKGLPLTKMYLTAALFVIVNESFKYTKQILQDNNAMLEFETIIDGIMVNGADIIECNENGKIVDFKVMIRPVKGLEMIQKKMLEMLNK